jgi:L-arabinose transport system ATP-binding protein
VRLLALDEPTSSLSDDEAQLLFSVVRQLRNEGVALVYISHRMPEIRALADRVAVLRDGRLVAFSPVDKLSEADIVHLMVGRPVSTLFDRSPASIGKVALETRGLTTARVRDVSMSIRTGEVVGLGGLMGAGRSELALAIFGQDRLTAGSVMVNGAEIRLRSPADAIAAGIGLAPEERKSQALLLMRSVAENVTLCVPDRISRFGFLRRAAVLLVASEQVERMRVKTSSLDELVSNLSGGNQQKVVLARWLARAPRVLILDEPTRGIDVGAKAEIYRLIAQLAANGIAILVISSELPELIGLSDRILVMAAGRIVGEVPRAEATEQRVLNLAMRENLSQEAA